MLQKWKLTKISFTKPHENITYKGSNKANAQHHISEDMKPHIIITTRQYAIDITFVITLTCFHNPWIHKQIS